MEKLITTIKLMAKTGVFFAHCDGKYDQHEVDFLNGFLGGIDHIGDIDETLRQEIKDSLNHTYTLEDIIEETQQLLEGFNEDEQKAIITSIYLFIRKVLVSDKNLESVEKKNFRLWKDTFGIEN